MSTINILALNQKEIELLEEILIFAERKSKNSEKRELASLLLDKIQLKYYYSPESIGKLKGYSPKCRRLYYYFYEKFDFDLIEYIKKIKKPLSTNEETFTALLYAFPPIRELLLNYSDSLKEMIESVSINN